ncbi:hypothetical protein C1646_803797 [Rhizophagus diaphanus]|nr:hypothetical protein C1646_803797 [Rhizophagus diaphanus] [Rhizophagus sp. MUCL 43196]
MTLIFHSSLLKDISSMLNNSDDFNVIIQVGENNNIKEFRAHSIILRARCPYFKSALSSEWIIRRNDMIMFNKPNINPTVFEMVLKYIYMGELNLTKYQVENILDLLVASDELLLEELFNRIQNYLIEEQSTWLQNNFHHVHHKIFKLSGCEKLRDHCLESICMSPQQIFTSNNYQLLDEDILYDLIKRDDLNVKEIDIFDFLIKWGIEQIPSLGSDKHRWSNSNYETLKETLNQLIPHIRFVEISAADYFVKVRPYKAIIPNDIYNEVKEYFIKGTLPKSITLTPRIKQSFIESKIIRKKLISIISNWIDNKESKEIRKKNDTIYKFELIYRGSKDGINNNSFKNKCNSQEQILVLIKCQNTKKILGGYTTVGFYHNVRRRLGLSHKNITSMNNFIFSFEDNNDTENMKLSRVITCNYAIYNNGFGDYGFNFGNDALSMKDQILWLKNKNGFYKDNVSKNSNYYYIIEDIEAFKVVKE